MSTNYRELGRQIAEYLHGTKFRVTWKCGHSAIRDVNAGKKKHLRVSETVCKNLFARYWGPGSSGVNWGEPCPVCRKEREKVHG